MSEQPIHVLLLEDNPGDARLVKEFLVGATDPSFVLERAADLEAGMRRLSDNGIDVVLLDLALPDSQGLETFNALHSIQPAVPVVVLSGTADEDLAVKAVKAGAQDYLVKGTESCQGLSRTLRYAIERKHAEEQIRRFNVELEKRVAERTAELEEANADLEAFAYSVSHDLRAPLRHIDGFVGLLEKSFGSAVDPRAGEYMQKIARAARRMGMLIDGLLSFSRVGRVGMSRVEIDLGPLVQSVIADLNEETMGRCVEWKVGPLGKVRGDPALLEVVLQNLLSNAAKFTAPRAPAIIEIGRQEDSATEGIFYVRDNGVGFDMQYVDNLFGVFQRLHSQDEFEGMGIGLANVHRVVGRHGGRVWAEGAVGKGATFYFSLPVSGSAKAT